MTGLRVTAAPIALALVLAGAAAESPAATYYVDRANPACSNANPGSEALPYCTISAAVSARGGPGTTLLVKPAVYREQVTINVSGASGNPFVIQALGAPVVVDGSDDFTNPALWALYAGDVWFASSATWAARQVVVDGDRLLPSTEALADLPPGTFRSVTGSGVWVNIGGDNPGLHGTFIGRRLNGFRLPTRSWVTLSGFEVVRSDDNGIYVLSLSSDVVVSDNRIALAFGNGISVVDSTRVTVRDNLVERSNRHGIYLLNGVSQSVVEGNESWGNSRIDGGGSNGIKLESSSENLVQRNNVHHNQDSGLQFSFTNTCISLLNRSWANADQGFDHLGSAATYHVGEIAYGNLNDGFSFEGNSTGSRVHNSISMANGTTTGHWDWYVDQSSATGFVSDHNIIWRPDGTPTINVSYTTYASVAALHAATGQEAHGLQADPQFVDPDAGDFSPGPLSPAIDSADASVIFWPAADALGRPRVDDPDTANTGAGTPLYADRGALEFFASCNGGAGPSPEVCDQIDNDCDGTADEGFTTGEPCTVGVGSCQASGVTVCAAGGMSTTCGAVAGTPAPEACDGADNDCDGVVDNVPAPAGSPEMISATLTAFSWEALPAATGYDVVRGDLLALLESAGDFVVSTGACVAANQPGTEATDASVPPAGQGHWYLVRGRNCGGTGTFDTGSASQAAPRDAGIEASGQACP